ncbi:MAG: hypothetical protein CMI09_00545 [Oceanospirillaceae bacterium]|nr:hypothetical protein [Oceanospirillaceae bacterium]|tara:strand:- start:1358 stop:1756 length:399 start_codon:yes stop_codon:yes gene_type:complete
MADKRAKLTGRKGNGKFLGIPHHVLESSAYNALDGWSVKLLVDIGKQYTGHNNGDLNAAYSVLKEQGWRSPGTLRKALVRLQDVGLIMLTRQGGKNLCSLYAITWQKIDDCKGKTEVTATKEPPNLWKQYRP